MDIDRPGFPLMSYVGISTVLVRQGKIGNLNHYAARHFQGSLSDRVTRSDSDQNMEPTFFLWL